MNDIEFRESFTMLYDFTPWYIDSTIEVGEEVAYKFLTSLESFIIILEHVVYVIAEATKKF